MSLSLSGRFGLSGLPESRLGLPSWSTKTSETPRTAFASLTATRGGGWNFRAPAPAAGDLPAVDMVDPRHTAAAAMAAAATVAVMVALLHAAAAAVAETLRVTTVGWSVTSRVTAGQSMGTAATMGTATVVAAGGTAHPVDTGAAHARRCAAAAALPSHPSAVAAARLPRLSDVATAVPLRRCAAVIAGPHRPSGAATTAQARPALDLSAVAAAAALEAAEQSF